MLFEKKISFVSHASTFSKRYSVIFTSFETRKLPLLNSTQLNIPTVILHVQNKNARARLLHGQNPNIAMP